MENPLRGIRHGRLSLWATVRLYPGAALPVAPYKIEDMLLQHSDAAAAALARAYDGGYAFEVSSSSSKAVPLSSSSSSADVAAAAVPSLSPCLPATLTCMPPSAVIPAPAVPASAIPSADIPSAGIPPAGVPPAGVPLYEGPGGGAAAAGVSTVAVPPASGLPAASLAADAGWRYFPVIAVPVLARCLDTPHFIPHITLLGGNLLPSLTADRVYNIVRNVLHNPPPIRSSAADAMQHNTPSPLLLPVGRPQATGTAKARAAGARAATAAARVEAISEAAAAAKAAAAAETRASATGEAAEAAGKGTAVVEAGTTAPAPAAAATANATALREAAGAAAAAARDAAEADTVTAVDAASAAEEAAEAATDISAQCRAAALGMNDVERDIVAPATENIQSSAEAKKGRETEGGEQEAETEKLPTPIARAAQKDEKEAVVAAAAIALQDDEETTLITPFFVRVEDVVAGTTANPFQCIYTPVRQIVHDKMQQQLACDTSQRAGSSNLTHVNRIPANAHKPSRTPAATAAANVCAATAAADRVHGAPTPAVHAARAVLVDCKCARSAAAAAAYQARMYEPAARAGFAAPGAAPAGQSSRSDVIPHPDEIDSTSSAAASGSNSSSSSASQYAPATAIKPAAAQKDICKEDCLFLLHRRLRKALFDDFGVVYKEGSSQYMPHVSVVYAHPMQLDLQQRHVIVRALKRASAAAAALEEQQQFHQHQEHTALHAATAIEAETPTTGASSAQQDAIRTSRMLATAEAAGGKNEAPAAGEEVCSNTSEESSISAPSYGTTREQDTEEEKQNICGRKSDVEDRQRSCLMKQETRKHQFTPPISSTPDGCSSAHDSSIKDNKGSMSAHRGSSSSDSSNSSKDSGSSYNNDDRGSSYNSTDRSRSRNTNSSTSRTNCSKIESSYIIGSSNSGVSINKGTADADAITSESLFSELQQCTRFSSAWDSCLENIARTYIGSLCRSVLYVESVEIVETDLGDINDACKWKILASIPLPSPAAQ